MTPHIEEGLIDLAIALAALAWAGISLKTGKIYLKPLGWVTRVQSAPVFWVACGVLLALTALMAQAAFRLITHG
ncbi:hypothetical protein [Caulobacter sp.]|uniref:hypothetical protein n=1 Tax=Caulobacter sp. TaxID=78 RepID=UPI001B2774A9|nr:hypothetical protein [Caulobacter sp.]MBO9545590.1 hypothetical protein [Caulobacter sp.]